MPSALSGHFHRRGLVDLKSKMHQSSDDFDLRFSSGVCDYTSDAGQCCAERGTSLSLVADAGTKKERAMLGMSRQIAPCWSCLLCRLTLMSRWMH